MNYRTLLILGKIWIIAALIKSVFTFWIIGFSDRVWLSITILCLHILVGMSICIYASKHTPNSQDQSTDLDETLIHPFFKIVKWSTMIALGFQLIASVIIIFFYFLNKEFEATLMVTFFSGLVLAGIIHAVEYYKDNKN